MSGLEIALTEHRFEHLFIECLGWDRVRAHVVINLPDGNAELTAVAHKRGFTVFVAPAHRTVLANRRLLRDIQRQLRKSYHEHILIHYCETPRKQVWQWATSLAGNTSLQHREHPFFSDRPPPRLLKRLEKLAIPLAEEEQIGLTDVLARVRQALLPDSEFELFAKHPWYAAQSDRLAMAVKRGEPGALQAFAEFHIPLARRSSRMLHRWFDMDPADAEQTAMIGLMEAARRFDPERGAQFSTYASYWLRARCQRLGLVWGLSMRLPNHWFWPCYKLLFVEAKLIATYGHSEARTRFAAELRRAEITNEQWVTFCRARHVECFSQVDKQQRTELRIVDDSAVVFDDAATHELQATVQRTLDLLNPRAANILRLRYGIDQREHTLQEVGELLNITRERVRQIQAKSEKRLKVLFTRAGIHFENSPEAGENESVTLEECMP